MMHCESCGADFRDPALYAYRENLDDENWTITTQTVCPYCGTDNIGYSTNDVVSYKNGNYERKFTNVVLR